MTRSWRLLPLLGLSLLIAAAGCAPAAAPSAGGPSPTVRLANVEHDYWVYVGAESADLMHRIRFGPAGASVERTVPVGQVPIDLEGPHGLAISRDALFLYLTTGHGVPDGKLWKYHVGADTLLAEPLGLGYFPATLDVTPDGLNAFVVNFNLHGEMVPSSVSVVETMDMVEVERTETCTMPHGSRISPDGRRHYSACMMDDQLVEIDTRTFQVSRRFSVEKGSERPLDRTDLGHHAHAGHQGSGGHGARYQASCSPTWAQPSPDGARIYVACNRSDEVLEVDAERWALTRRFPTGRGPYNLGVTPDGRLLVVTLKQGNAVEFIELARGESVGRTETSTTVVHGVVVSPDGRFAFVSVEGVGAEPGKVDIYDLARFARVAEVEVGQQASGIAFWRMERASGR